MSYQKLTIKDLEVKVHLGLSHKEQKRVQKVRWTIQLTYTSTSQKSTSPNVCYEAISKTILKFSKSQKFLLVEFMVKNCFDLLKKEFPQVKYLKLILHKVHPPVKNLKGGVIYEYGDE